MLKVEKKRRRRETEVKVLIKIFATKWREWISNLLKQLTDFQYKLIILHTDILCATMYKPFRTNCFLLMMTALCFRRFLQLYIGRLKIWLQQKTEGSNLSLSYICFEPPKSTMPSWPLLCQLTITITDVYTL